MKNLKRQRDYSLNSDDQEFSQNPAKRQKYTYNFNPSSNVINIGTQLNRDFQQLANQLFLNTVQPPVKESLYEQIDLINYVEFDEEIDLIKNPVKYFQQREIQIREIIRKKKQGKSNQIPVNQITSTTNQRDFQDLPDFVIKDNCTQQILTELQGLNIYFPYKPYPCQLIYMDKLITALNTNQNALLESPTGTGKTMSLLCSSLAWKISNPQVKCQIIYASRTHSQLIQVIESLKLTAYQPKTVLLASRDHLCVNEEVKMDDNKQKVIGKALSLACQSLVTGIFKNRDQIHDLQNPPAKQAVCEYYQQGDNLTWEPLKIEELYKIGKKQMICPYFIMKKRLRDADIVFMSYNYLIDPEIRSKYNIQIQNSIILIDEAHNIARSAEEVYSLKITVNDVQKSMEPLVRLLKNVIKNKVNKFKESFQSNQNDLKLMVDIFDQIKNFILQAKLPKELLIESQKISTDFIDKLRLSYQENRRKLNDFKIQQHNNFVDAVIDLTEIELSESAGLDPNQINSCLSIFRLLKNCLKFQSNSGIYLAIEKEDGFKSQPENRKLNIICVEPKTAFLSLIDQRPRSVILTSGTLKPLDSFELELGLKFKYKLENKHVVEDNRVKVFVLSQGEQGCKLDFSYNQMKDQKVKREMIKDLGLTLLSMTRMVPGGMLVFFPSKFLMSECNKQWQEQNIFQNIVQFNENEYNSEFIDKFKQQIDQKLWERGQAVLLMGWCRGKISEGLDFADDAARLVCVIGIPNPYIDSPEVKLKQIYLDQKRLLEFGQKQCLDGKSWYNQQAPRATNQAIGRVIRHINDYGCIVLIDQRYEQLQNRNYLSGWLQDKIMLTENAKKCRFEMSRFFEEMNRSTESTSQNSSLEIMYDSD